MDRSGAARIQLEITEGDLFAQKVDALINPWNRNFVPRWLLRPGGVSKQLKTRTGPAPWIELARLGTLPLGTAVRTTGGRMDIDIIHVAGISAAWRATESVSRSCTNAVNLAWRTGYTSIATPLIGAGHGGLNPATALASMRAALEGFPQHGDHQMHVTLVILPTHPSR